MLAARAFAAYVRDKLAAVGKKSDSLTAKAHNKHYFGMKPFPEGEERTNINSVFDRLFAAIREHDGIPKSEGGGTV